MAVTEAVENMKNFVGPFESFGSAIDMGVGIYVLKYKHCLLHNINHL